MDEEPCAPSADRSVAARRRISVAPYRERDGRIEVLLVKCGDGRGLITGDALARRPLHEEARSLAKSAAQVMGPVQKRPLRVNGAQDEAAMIFALEARRWAESEGIGFAWEPLDQALSRLPSSSGAALSDLPVRVRLLTRKR